MQKLSEMKFDDSQILNNEQQQAILGGKRIRTGIEIGGSWHKDVWRDKNNNGERDEGDKFKIRYMVIPTPPGPGYEEVAEAEISMLEVTWCNDCEDWDNPSEDDECCELPE